ncbi:hypothetical protein BpHYR1_029497 [Brachionus plicatilis]|uniref:Uncharacterized protein n=1 Tax=Brachionus plicatilis TaxID=10195 RepID=A0A3M7RY29_BRAPC|nr:hypothetical protein BpHYR1_029497 [Brachionus plicatilis]
MQKFKSTKSSLFLNYFYTKIIDPVFEYAMARIPPKSDSSLSDTHLPADHLFMNLGKENFSSKKRTKTQRDSPNLHFSS